MHDDLVRQHAALTQRAGLVDLSNRTQIELRGEDRATFLHGLCSNDIKGLAPGQGCEAFLPNAQGKILGYVFVFAGPDSIVLESSPGQQRIIPHLDRYLIRERVTLHDRSTEWGEWLLAGPTSVEVLSRVAGVALPTGRLAHGAATIAGSPAWMRRVDLTGPIGFLVAGPRAGIADIAQALVDAGAEFVDWPAFEAARIEAGSPFYGRDISDANLPQEVGRDAQAISFRKGCYIGQETVARIDALGHVNRRLVGVRFDGTEIPAAGTVLTVGAKTVGEVTSATWSPRLSAPLALAYVRREHQHVRAELESPLGTATVVAIPLADA